MAGDASSIDQAFGLTMPLHKKIESTRSKDHPFVKNDYGPDNGHKALLPIRLFIGSPDWIYRDEQFSIRQTRA